MSLLGFYSWMERGLAAYLTEGYESAAEGPQAPLIRARVELVEQRPGAERVEELDVTIDVATAHHVVGIEPGIVTRVWPKPGTTDAETDYFALIEFADADFPWRYSPERGKDVTGGTSARTPWIALVVLGEDELEYRPAGPNRRLPSIRVLGGADVLPPSDELHLWAHAQVSGGIAAPAALEQTLRRNPERVASRLICPRFLAPRQRYRAFLVPTYRGGADVGLGRSVSSILAPAWSSANADDVELPVYYEWSFVTGDVGSFYDLARRLVPRRLTGSGTRGMDVSHPGLADLDGKATTVAVAGALRPVDAVEPEWPAEERNAWRAALAPIVNQPEILLDTATIGDPTSDPPPKPKLAPPLYGRWYAGVGRIEGGTTSGEPLWFQQLNEAPHQRVPAALGTAVIQGDQQALMASAWQQVDGLLAANQQIRQAQLAREASLQSYRRHVVAAPRPGSVLQLGGAIFGRVLTAGGRTVLDAVRRSPVPDGVFDPVWRRLTRPLGPIGRRQRRPDLALPPVGGDTIDQLNDGTLDPAPAPPEVPSGAVAPGGGGVGECPVCLTDEILDAIVSLPVADVYRLGEALFLEGKLYAGFGTLWRVAIMRLGLLLIEAAATPDGLAAFRDRIRRECRGAVVSDDLDDAPPIAGSWTPVEPVPDNPGTPPPPAPDGTAPSQTELDFRDAADALLEALNATPLPGPVLTKVDVPRLATELLAAIDPHRTIAEALRRRLTATFHWTPEDTLEPMLVVPEFPQPMYEPLRDLSTEWIMPGIGEVDANTLAMVMTNQAFVEAYMVGLNHEMARELLWHEYPNDLRGTSFRQFWDVRGRIDPPATPDGTYDIRRIHRWGDSPLGVNSARDPVDALVLLLRGDLLHRYPNVVVYAAQADWTPDGDLPPPQPTTQERYPLFRGKLGGDAGLFGFDLTPPVARGTGADVDPGWYVVLQEPHAEPRFGIPEELSPEEPDPDSALAPPVPGSFLRRGDDLYRAAITAASDHSSALAAQRLYRSPVRVAFHARMMLPPENA